MNTYRSKSIVEQPRDEDSEGSMEEIDKMLDQITPGPGDYLD